MLLRTLLRHQHHHHHGFLTHAQAQQLRQLPLDTVLRRLQSSSLTNPARSLEVHFQMQPVPEASPSSPLPNAASTHDADEALVPLRAALSDILLARTGLTDDASRNRRAAVNRTAASLSVEEWSLLAANAMRHGLDGGLTRLAVQHTLEAIQKTSGQPDAMAGTAALIRLLEACVDPHTETAGHAALAVLSLSTLDALVAAVKGVWDGAEGWRADDGDLSVYALFSQFLGLTVACVSTDDYYGGVGVIGGGSAATAEDTTEMAANAEPADGRAYRGGGGGAAPSTPMSSGSSPLGVTAPPATRRWSEVLLPRLTLTVDANLVLARCARLCTDVCQHLARCLTPPAQTHGVENSSSSFLSSPSTRRQASLAESLRLCQIAVSLQTATTAAVPGARLSSTDSPASAAWATPDSGRLARTFIPAWLSFARSTSGTSAPSSAAGSRAGSSTAGAFITPPLSSPLPSPSPTSSAAVKPEWAALRVRVAVELRAVSLAHLTLVLADPCPSTTGTPARTRHARGPSRASSDSAPTLTHPRLATLPLTDVVTLLQLACDASLHPTEANLVLSHLSVHVSSVLAQLARGARGGRSNGGGRAAQSSSCPVPFDTSPTRASFLPAARPLEDPATLSAILAVGELHLSLDSRHGTASLFASVLVCVAQAAPALWGEGRTSGELWNRACALVEAAPLIARDAAHRAFWSLADAVGETSDEASLLGHRASPDHRQGLLTLMRFLVEEEEKGALATPASGDVTVNGTLRSHAPSRAALITTTASQTLATAFSQHGVAGLKGAVRTLHVFTLVLEGSAASDGAEESARRELCWHVVVHALENLQRLSTQLSSPTRSWTAWLSASEVSSLRRALRWASAAPRTTASRNTPPPPGHTQAVPALETRSGGTTRRAPLPPHRPGAAPDSEAVDCAVLEAAKTVTGHAEAQVTRRSQTRTGTPAPMTLPCARPGTASGDGGADHIATLSKELHRQLVVP